MPVAPEPCDYSSAVYAANHATWLVQMHAGHEDQATLLEAMEEWVQDAES